MALTATATIDRFTAAREAVSALPSHVADYRALSENDILRITGELAEIVRVANARLALLAGELDHRSRHALGRQGLVQRQGHRTVESFLKHTAGITGQQVGTALKAGRLVAEIADDGRVDDITGEVMTALQPWLVPVGEALTSGTLSTSAAEVIAAVLGVPNSVVTTEDLAVAAGVLVRESVSGMHPDRLRHRARELRDDLDASGVKPREHELHEQRSLTHFPLPGGGGKAILVMGSEDYALFAEVVDRAVSPKLRGVRFRNQQQAELAERIEADPRTVPQLAIDAVLQLIRQGADYDTSFMLGSGAPVIRVTVAEEALNSRTGLGRIHGIPEPVSLETVERLLCSGEIIRMGFDPAGNVLDLEKEQRLFSRRQRHALEVKFGGCMDPWCDRPAAHCEAHHILQWTRDGGKTEIRNGILLCKYHHLTYHNEHYEIVLDELGAYWLIPPGTVDPDRTPVAMRTKSLALKDLRHATA